VILGIDTDVLVSWVMTGTARHTEASRIIEDQVRRHGASLAITPIVLREFVHVVTDPKRFPHPLLMEEALRRAWSIWDSEEVLQTIPGPDVLPRTLELLSAFQLGRKRIADTALAATLEIAGVRRLATFNPSDFKIFEFLDLVDPPTPEGPRPRLV